MEEPIFTSNLLHLKCEKRKGKVSEKVMEKRLKRAIKAKPRSYTLWLYKDHIKLHGQREPTYLDKVKRVKESKEHLVLVLSNKPKDKTKCSLITMKFKTINDFTNVLRSVTEAMKAQKEQGKGNDFQQAITETESSVSKRNSIKREPILPSNLHLPRINASVSTGWCGDIEKLQKFCSVDRSRTVGQARMEALKRTNRRRKEYSPVPTRSHYSGYTKERCVSWTEDSDYCSTFTSDFDLYFDSSETESDTISSCHYRMNRGNCKDNHVDGPKGKVSEEFIRDSLGNQIHILRPRVTRPRSVAY